MSAREVAHSVPDLGSSVVLRQPLPSASRIAAEATPICDRLETLRRGIRSGRPFWPMEPCVYFIGAGNGFVKIGYSTNLTSRLCDLQGANPERLEVLARVRGGRDLESAYHRRFASARHFYEWFRRTPEIESEIARLNKAQEIDDA